MKVFVAGATGVIGWRAVARLVEAGHEVTGVARSDEKAAKLRDLGATPVRVDLFDPRAVKGAVDGHDVVVNLATHIPPMAKAALPGEWHENDRIRTEASRNLVDAALATGATRYIQESITFLYEDAAADWIDEASPRRVPPFARSVDAAEAEAARFTDTGGAGVVLRFGLFYGPDSHHTRDAIRMVEKRLPAALGASDSFISSISTDDAAAAVVAALVAPAGTYNVVDDEPVTRGEYGRILAYALGVKPPRQGLSVMARAGGSKAEMLTRSQRVSNRTFKQRTGWSPADDNVRVGLPRVVAALRERGFAMSQPSRLATVLRVVLGGLTASSLLLGAWAAIAPRSFYDSFPNGRGWVAADGPYNEHLVRDFGGLNLALAVVGVVAVVKFTPILVRTAAAAMLAFGVPHLLYHLTHLDVYDGFDLVANAVSLSVSVVLAGVVLALAGRVTPGASGARA